MGRLRARVTRAAASSIGRVERLDRGLRPPAPPDRRAADPVGTRSGARPRPRRPSGTSFSSSRESTASASDLSRSRLTSRPRRTWADSSTRPASGDTTRSRSTIAMEDSPLSGASARSGQHIEMGIAEMNLVLLLGQLGLSWDFQRERLFPIGTLYDPFVMRALEGIVYSTYSGSRFVLAGTPSGISLSREGGAHQSIITPGIGIETPGLTYAEPCYARELEWLLLDALSRMQEPDGEALYLRLSTKPIDQAPFSDAVARIGEERLRADVVAGGFRLREPGRVRGSRRPRVLRRDRPRSARGGRAACRPGRRRGDRALPLLARSAVSRLAGEQHRARCEAARLAHRISSRSSLPASRACPSSRSSTVPATRWPSSARRSEPAYVPLGVDRFGQTGSAARGLRGVRDRLRGHRHSLPCRPRAEPRDPAAAPGEQLRLFGQHGAPEPAAALTCAPPSLR